jgi:hypothetical protein
MAPVVVRIRAAGEPPPVFGSLSDFAPVRCCSVEAAKIDVAQDAVALHAQVEDVRQSRSTTRAGGRAAGWA